MTGVNVPNFTYPSHTSNAVDVTKAKHNSNPKNQPTNVNENARKSLKEWMDMSRMCKSKIEAAFETPTQLVATKPPEIDQQRTEVDLRTEAAKTQDVRIAAICERIGDATYEKDKKDLNEVIAKGRARRTLARLSDTQGKDVETKDKSGTNNSALSQLCTKCRLPGRYCLCAKMTGFYTTRKSNLCSLLRSSELHCSLL